MATRIALLRSRRSCSESGAACDFGCGLRVRILSARRLCVDGRFFTRNRLSPAAVGAVAFVVDRRRGRLVYGTYSLTLASRRRRPSWSIVLLVVANSAWAFACVWWSMLHWPTASVLGQVQLLGEALFVGALAAIEWRYRRVLVGAAQRSPEYGFGSL